MVLGVKGSVNNCVFYLEVGVDDYLIKFFGIWEFIVCC